MLVVSPAGHAAGDASATLREALAGFHTDGYRRIVIDLAELDYLDSAALGELVASQVRAIRLGVPLKLANPDKRLRDLLMLTRLTTVFETYDSLADALESFEPSVP